ncbi:MAG TPA: PPC domain-containing protein [Pirellulaceae bacterium]|nr:PPC domain-containing protein [Pirellulaceae bacterium]
MLRHFPQRAAFVALAALLTTGASAAPPEVTSFSPTGIQRGQTAEIAVAGNLPGWPLQIWTEFPGLTIEPAADKGKLKVTAAADAPAGIHWIRLANGEGASAPRPFFVGTLPEIEEKEPNQTLAEATPISNSSVVSGKLAKRGDVDLFAVTLQPGQTLVADLLANEVLGSPMDAVLQLCDQSGTILAQQHDTRGLDPRLVFAAPAAGTYYVRLFAFPSQPDSSINFAGGDNYLYRLTLTTGPFVDHTLPLAVTRETAADLTLAGWNLPSSVVRLEPAAHLWRESWFWQPPDAEGLLPLRLVDHPSLVVAPSASPEMPQPASVPAILTGELESPRDVDAVAIEAKKGQRLEIKVASESLGYEADPVVAVVDAAGKSLAENDDGRRNERDAAISFTAPADGTYQVQIRDLHGRGGLRMVYTCTIAEASPDYALSIAAGGYRVAPESMVEIPVTINRVGGFKDEIEIAAVGLPAGVTAEVVKSPGEGDASKSVKLLLKAAADAQGGPLRIVGKSAGTTPRERTATFESTQGTAKFLHRDLWLSAGK